jgi:hypothetical protein
MYRGHNQYIRKIKDKVNKSLTLHLLENNIPCREKWWLGSRTQIINRANDLKDIELSFIPAVKYPSSDILDNVDIICHKWKYVGTNKWYKMMRKSLVDFILHDKHNPEKRNNPNKKPTNTSIPKYEYNMSLIEPILKDKGYIENDTFQISEDKTVLRVLLDKESQKFIDVLLNKKKKDYLNCCYSTDTIYTYSLDKFKSIL